MADWGRSMSWNKKENIYIYMRLSCLVTVLVTLYVKCFLHLPHFLWCTRGENIASFWTPLYVIDNFPGTVSARGISFIVTFLFPYNMTSGGNKAGRTFCVPVKKMLHCDLGNNFLFLLVITRGLSSKSISLHVQGQIIVTCRMVRVSYNFGIRRMIGFINT
jgi:hypothetical protein